MENSVLGPRAAEKGKRHYLLTGATGVIGSAILKRLYQNGEQVSFLIRADSAEHLKRRLEKLYGYCVIDPENTSRVVPIRASLLENHFGLNSNDYARLANICTHIIHCAADVNLNRPEDRAIEQTSNIARNMLRMMEDMTAFKKMEYVSTIGVAGKVKGSFQEDWVADDCQFRNSYELAKYVSENLVKEKIEDGWNITVHRPSMVIGDSESGEIYNFQVFYYICEFLTGRHTFGLIPDFKTFILDTVPIDYVSDVIYWSSRNEHLSLKILHLVSGEVAVSLNSLAGSVSAMFFEVKKKPKKVSLSLFKTIIRVLSLLPKTKWTKSFDNLSIFLSYLAENQSFSNQRTLSMLSSSNISLPDPEFYIPNSLAFYRRQKPL